MTLRRIATCLRMQEGKKNAALSPATCIKTNGNKTKLQSFVGSFFFFNNGISSSARMDSFLLTNDGQASNVADTHVRKVVAMMQLRITTTTA